MNSRRDFILKSDNCKSALVPFNGLDASDFYKMIVIIIIVYVSLLALWYSKAIINHLQHVFNPSNRQQAGKILLHKAITDGNFVSSVNILKQYNLFNEEINFDGYTPLLLASLHRNTQLVKYLIQNGADINAVTAKGENAFYLAVYNQIHDMKSRDASCIHALFHAGVDINVPNSRGYTSLQVAAFFGHRNLVLWLLLKKAKTNLSPHPYDIAKSQGHHETAKLLK